MPFKILPMNSLWTEKYRPTSQEQLDAPAHIIQFLQTARESGFPHLLLYGPPGTGKTTFALLLKPTFSLNASDERGIDTIRNKIKKLANTAAKQIILLDECENLTRDSQACLRRILEDYPNTTFIFCTNYINRIIAPLKSRLLKIKFVARSCDSLERIGQAEDMGRDSEFYRNLFSKCNGDLRRCINVMQGIKPIKDVNVDDVVGRVPESVIEDFWTFKDHREFVSGFTRDGYSSLQLIQQLNESPRGNEQQKARFSSVLAEMEGMSIKGCSDELLVLNLCISRMEIYSLNK